MRFPSLQLWPTYLCIIGNKHLLGLLDHGLGLQLVLGEAMLAGVEEFAPWDAGQDQVSGVRLVVDVHFDLFGIHRGRSDAVFCHFAF